MADINDQAQAIWKTLDQMLEKNPDGYKKFIDEQIESSKKFFASTQKIGQISGLKNMSEEKSKKLENLSIKNSTKKNSSCSAPKSSTDLTDDVFSMTSMLASICPQNNKDDGDDEDEFSLKELKIPGQNQKKGKLGDDEKKTEMKMKYLIEEL